MNLRTKTNWLLVTALASLPVLAAGGLGVKTGTWETTVTTKTSGMMMPADVLAKMNAEQRAQMEAMMSKRAAAGPHSITSKSCVTQKDIDAGAFRAQQAEADSKCTYKPGAGNSSKHQEWTFECPGQKGVSGGSMVVDAVDSTHVNGVMHVKANAGTVDSTFTSKWLGASCADADK
jgi:hypothetical protein